MTLAEMNEFRGRWEAHLNMNNDGRHYVYLYRHPAENGGKGKVFYVGKGCGNRVFAHLDLVRPEDRDEVDKVKVINDLRDQNLAPDIDILRDGMSEKDAFMVESAVIDAIGLKNLTNIHRGNKSSVHPIQESPYIIYDAIFNHRMLGVSVDKLFPMYFPELMYNHTIERDWGTLHECASWCWDVSPISVQRKNIEYYFATRKKIIIEVFKLEDVLSIGRAIEIGKITLAEDNKVSKGFTYRTDVNKIVNDEMKEKKRMLFGSRVDDDIRNQYIGKRAIIGQGGFRYFG